MSEIAERYRKVAGRFTELTRAVPEGAWDRPAPCEGWVARDVVRHLVGWMPGLFLDRAGIVCAPGPSVESDPAGAWASVSDTIQAALDAPELATRPYDTPLGPNQLALTLEQAVGMFGIGDILVHTWDLARATGLDETLDADEVHRLLEGMVAMDEPMRQSGHFGPRVEVAHDADEQTKLIAFTGRHP